MITPPFFMTEKSCVRRSAHRGCHGLTALAISTTLAIPAALQAQEQDEATRDESGLETIVVTGTGTGCFIVLWAVLQAGIPQRITVEGSMIEIRRSGQTDRFDLEDPGVDIRVGDGEIAFAHYMDRWVVVRARDVDWKVFSDIVMRYQNNADRYAEERDKRFGR